MLYSIFDIKIIIKIAKNKIFFYFYMKTEEQCLEEIEALTSARLGNMRKEINAASWTDNMEVLMKHWGEKAAGLRFMHSHTGRKWKNFSDNLSISGILVTVVASSLSLIESK